MKIEIINNFEYFVREHPKVYSSEPRSYRYRDCVIREYKCKHCSRIVLRLESINYKIEQLVIIEQDELRLELHLMNCPDYNLSRRKKKPYYNNDISK